VTNDYGYFRFTEFKKEEEGHIIEDEFESLINELNTKQVGSLVLDLRYNSGGDPYLAGRMATHFTTEPFPLFGRLILTRTRKITYASYMVRNFAYRFRLAGTRVFGDHREKVNYERGLRDYTPSPLHFDGTVYVLTSSMTGSAATMLCKYLQCLPNVRFVGSETNGATNYFCAHKHCELTLPGNDIYATFGMQLIELEKGSSDEEKPHGIIPVNSPAYTIDDLIHSRDKEMEWIRNDISSHK
jgi:C-terminal processing protease CtpA/Prc